MPLDMPESVLVRFKGSLQPGITLRDVVNAIPYQAIQKGLLTVPKKNKKNVFNGRVLEMEGLPDLSVEQAPLPGLRPGLPRLGRARRGHGGLRPPPDPGRVPRELQGARGAEARRGVPLPAV